MTASPPISSNQRRVLHRGTGVQCTIYVVQWQGKLAAVKDYSETPPFFRFLIAPYLLRREMKALQALQGIEGVPKLLGRAGRHAFAMELIDGKPISEMKAEELDNNLMQKAQQIIDAIHARHIAHGDLKRRTNFLVTPQRDVFIIDYASAIIGGKWWRPVTNWIQWQVAEIDNKAVAKIKKLGAPHLLTEREKVLLETPTGLERWARKLLNR